MRFVPVDGRAPPIQHGPSQQASIMNPRARFILAILLGLSTSLAMAALLSWVGRESGVAFHTYTLWFVIPAGALLSGFLAASGFFAGARLWHCRPSLPLLATMVLASLGSYVTIHWLDHHFMRIEGIRVADYVPFGEYWRVATSHQSLRVHLARVGTLGGPPMELGMLGYGYSALQVLGFAAGALAIYAHLDASPYCDACQRYFSGKLKTVRYWADRNALQDFVGRFFGLVQAGSVLEAISAHAVEAGEEKFDPKAHFLATAVRTRECRACGRFHLSFVAQARAPRGEWEPVKGTEFSTVADVGRGETD